MAAVRMRLPSFVLVVVVVVVVVTASRSISAIFWDLDLSLGLCFSGRSVSLRQSPTEPSPQVLGMAISGNMAWIHLRENTNVLEQKLK